MRKLLLVLLVVYVTGIGLVAGLISLRVSHSFWGFLSTTVLCSIIHLVVVTVGEQFYDAWSYKARDVYSSAPEYAKGIATGIVAMALTVATSVIHGLVWIVSAIMTLGNS
jgi:hypothetical protein